MGYVLSKITKKTNNNEIDDIRYLLSQVLFRKDNKDPKQLANCLMGIMQTKKVAIHGAGKHTLEILKHIPPDIKKSIIAISDNSKYSQTIDIFTIIKPQDLNNYDVDYILLSSDVYQKRMMDELVGMRIAKSKMLDLYKVPMMQLKEFAAQSSTISTVNNVVDEVAGSKNPCVVISNSIALNHLRIFKYLAREFDLFIVTSNPKIQSLELDSFKKQFNITILESHLDVIKVASLIDKGIIITINGIYWNSLGAVCTLMCKVPSYAIFIDLLSSAYQTNDRLNLLCDSKKEFIAESILWRYGSGVIYKESNELANKLILKYKPTKSLQFVDYCDSEINTNIADVDINSVRFVYAGGLLSPNSGDLNCNHHLSIMEVVRSLNNQGHSFTIYNAYDNGTTSNWSYYNQDKLSNYEYKTSISIFDLPYELSNYNIGVVLFNFGVDGVENSNYYKYGGFSKIMAYIEAGLPVIISQETEFMAKIVEEHNIGLAIKWDEISSIPKYLTSKNIKIWQANIQKFKNSFSYSNNISKLVDFVKS